jgi:hypothetical protein
MTKAGKTRPLKKIRGKLFLLCFTTASAEEEGNANLETSCFQVCIIFVSDVAKTKIVTCSDTETITHPVTSAKSN